MFCLLLNFCDIWVVIFLQFIGGHLLKIGKVNEWAIKPIFFLVVAYWKWILMGDGHGERDDLT